MQIKSVANKIVKSLQQDGKLAYWVGGAVRDLFLKRKNFDIDIATNAKTDQIKRLLQDLSLPFFNIGEKFGTLVVSIDGKKIEITTFRAESVYKDFRHPNKVKFTSTPAEDAKRRDFTINAMYLNPLSNELIDFFNGKKDLANKVIRFVGSPMQRIKEDPLRMLRAVRFAVILNFKIEPKSFLAIKRCAKYVSKISGERIKQELDKIMQADNYAQGFELLDKSGLLKIILPELDHLKSVKQSKNYHAEGNAFVHTMRVLKNANSKDYIYRYACLFHDLGKVDTGFNTVRNGRPHISFPQHGPRGSHILSAITKRLRFSAKESKKISWLVTHHMDLRHPELLTDKTLIRWSKNDDIFDLINLRISDDLGSIHTDSKERPLKHDFKQLQSIARKLSKWRKLQTPNFVTGQDVMSILGIKPGQKVGEILERVKHMQRRGKIKNRKQGITFLKSLDN